MLPKVVVSAIRVSSCCSCATSSCRAARSSPALEPLADWMASSRIRCRILVDSCSAPSAVCARDIPSFALRTAWFNPRICEVRRSEIARPAASSRAELILKPEDKRCNEVANEFCELFNDRCALSEATFVLINCGIVFLLTGLRHYAPGRLLSSCRSTNQTTHSGVVTATD